MRATVELKRLDPEAKIPAYQTPGAAAMDLHACIPSPVLVKPGEYPELIPTGIAIWIRDPGFVGIIAPRSSLGAKKGLVLANTIGVIDSDYQGPLMVAAWNRNPQITTGPIHVEEGYYQDGPVINECDDVMIEPGDRLAQLLIMPVAQASFLVMNEFSDESKRGKGGLGSTGVAA